MSGCGIKIAKVGKKLTSLLSTDYLFHSKYNLFKGDIIGNFNQSVTYATETVVTIPHNYGYKPSFQAYFSGDGSNTYYCPVANGDMMTWLFPNRIFNVTAYSTKTNLVFILWNNNNPGPDTCYLKYYIFKEEIE